MLRRTPPTLSLAGPLRSGRLKRIAFSRIGYSLRRDDSDFVVFCFAKPEDAEAFAERFGGKRLAMGSR
jgi:hypothetical protein